MSTTSENIQSEKIGVVQMADPVYCAKIVEIKRLKKGLHITQNSTDALRDAIDRELAFWRTTLAKKGDE